MTMADEVQGSIRNGNGERFELRLGSQSLGLQTKDLVTIVLLLVIGIFGYLIFLSIKDDHSRLGTQQAQMQDNQYRHLVEATERWRTAVDEIKEMLRGQNTRMDGNNQTLRTMLEVLDWNMGRNLDEHLPLQVPLPGKAP
jgi:hypothetical protein